MIEFITLEKFNRLKKYRNESGFFITLCGNDFLTLVINRDKLSEILTHNTFQCAIDHLKARINKEFLNRGI